mgnify:CR=1 FL=1
MGEKEGITWTRRTGMPWITKAAAGYGGGCRRSWTRIRIEGELGDRRAYLEAARRAPNPAARRMMQRMADREGAHARRLLAVYYLACGQCYRPALASGPGETLPWRQLLRQRYHQEVWAARQYDQAAQSVGDPCLAGLFRELSREEDCHARQLLGLLEQNILAF